MDEDVHAGMKLSDVVKELEIIGRNMASLNCTMEQGLSLSEMASFEKEYEKLFRRFSVLISEFVLVPKSEMKELCEKLIVLGMEPTRKLLRKKVLKEHFCLCEVEHWEDDEMGGCLVYSSCPTKNDGFHNTGKEQCVNCDFIDEVFDGKKE